MSCENKLPLAHTPYAEICTKGCPNFKRDGNGRPCCLKMDGEGYGQLDELVREGAACPEGHFGNNEKLADSPPEEPAEEAAKEGTTIFDHLINLSDEIVFRFNDGEMIWRKK